MSYDGYDYEMNPTNAVGISVLSPDGSVEYTYFEDYIPYAAQTDYMWDPLLKHVEARNLGNGSFGLSFNFTDAYELPLETLGYYVTYFPTNNSYERIVFDGLIALPFLRRTQY